MFRRTAVARGLDRAGLWASAACGVHCALGPVAVALLPAAAAAWWAQSERWHVPWLAVWSAFAVAMTWWGARRHRRFHAWLFLGAGLAWVWGTAALAPGPVEEAAGMAIGGTLLACAHWTNLRQSHGHVHDATCEHARGASARSP